MVMHHLSFTACVPAVGNDPTMPITDESFTDSLRHLTLTGLAVLTGFEPAISSVTGKRVNRYSTEPWHPLKESNPA